MNKEEKKNIIEHVVEKYLEPYIKLKNKKLLPVFNELTRYETRSMIIIATSYLEEICKDCVYESMTINGSNEFQKRHGKELTFSLSSTLLYANDYISKDVFQILNNIRGIRNKYAHAPLIEENIKNSISDKIKNIENLMGELSSFYSDKLDSFKNIKSETDRKLFMIFDTLIFAFIGFKMYLIPQQKIVKLEILGNPKSIKINRFKNAVNNETEYFFIEKFKRKTYIQHRV